MEDLGHMRRLLIVSCSKTKRKLENAPAMEVYDGPVYKILRKNLKQNLDILIISAKYGLIKQDQLISYYDLQMTDEIAESFRNELTATLSKIINNNSYEEIFIELGKTYQRSIDFKKLEFNNQNLIFDNGTIGMRLHNLKKWLGSSAFDGSAISKENNIN